MRTAAILLALLASTSLSACGTVAETVHAPQLGPMGYPTALVPQEPLPISATARGPAPQAASANSLWRAGARTFFTDQRANRVGDILTVQIMIDDSATTSNSSTSSRSSSTGVGVPNLLGFENSIAQHFPTGFDPANLVNSNSDTSNAGAGAISRQEKISLTVAAVVTQILPNGNMVLQGNQQIRTNNEVRQVTLSGIVRPEDITSANTVKDSQLAELRVDYGGRGDQSRVQRTPAGQSLLERFTPF